MLKMIKEKLKKYWKWILGILIPVAFTATLLVPTEIPFVIVNGEKIEFAYTDNNDGENLIIRTDKKIYKGEGNADVYVMIENKSGAGQTIAFQSLFNDNLKTAKDISILKKTVPYQEEINDYGTTTYDCSYVATSTGEMIEKTCEKEIVVSTSTETKYRDEWQEKEISTITEADILSLITTKNIITKDVKGFPTDKIIDFPLLANGIAYLKIRIEFPRYSEGEFFLEAIGSEGAMGLLDPWYQESVTYARQALANPTMNLGTINSGTYADTLTSDDSRLILNDTATSTATSTYDFSICGTDCNASTSWWASADDVDVFPFAGVAANRNTHIQATDAQYASTSISDNTRYASLDPGAGDEIFFWVEMVVNETTTAITSLSFTFEGYSALTSDFTIYVLKAGQAWETSASWAQVGELQSITGNVETSFTRSTTTISDYLTATSSITWGIYQSISSETVYTDYVKLDVGYTTTSDAYKLDFNFDGVSPTDQWGDYTDVNQESLHAIEITLEAKDSLSTDDYYAMLWNFDTSAWVEVGAVMSIGTTEETFTRNVASGFASYLNDNDEIKFRIANGKALAKGGAPDNDGQLEIDYAIIKASNWLTGWTYRKLITFSATTTTSTLTNFPVAVILASSTNFDFTKARSDGYDIRFTDSGGTTTLDFERERYSTTTGNAEFWVEIPSIATSSDATTTFYMYYGNSVASDASSSTAPWDANFVAVYHSKDNTTSQILDSTTNANTGTKKAANEPIEANGKIAKAQDYDGTDDKITIADSASLNADIETANKVTIEALFKMDTIPAGNEEYPYRWMVDKGDRLCSRVYRGTVNQTANIMMRLYVTNASLYMRGTASFVIDTWYYTVVSWESGSGKMYLNGEPDARTEGTLHTATGSIVIDTTALWLGMHPATIGPYFNGIMDEVRISKSVRSAAWIKASHNSGNDSLLTYGGEETSGQALQKILDEVFASSDSITKQLILYRTFTEIFNITDTISKRIRRSLAETFNLTDTIIRKAIKTLDETFAISDSIQKIGNYIRTLTETLNLSDTIQKIQGLKRTLIETFNITDIIQKAQSLKRTLAETFASADSIIRGIGKTLAEQFNIKEIFKRYVNGLLIIWTKLAKLATSWSKKDKPDTVWTGKDKPSTIWSKLSKPE